MIFYLKNTAWIYGLNTMQKKMVEKHLTLSNPLFVQRLDMGLANWGVNQYLTYYKHIDKNGIEIPIGAVPDITMLLQNAGADIQPGDVIDNRISNILPDYFSTINFTGTLRDYQDDVITACQKSNTGVIEAMTGAGKTICFVALTVLKKEPTLIMVNTIELANQTIDAFCEFTNINKDDVGFIGSGKFNVKPVSVCLHQTLTRMEDYKWDLLTDYFGMVIADETHIIPSMTFYRNIGRLNAKYKYGFSATPFRTDGLTKVIHFATGPTIHVVPKEKLEHVLMKPKIKYVNTSYFYPLLSSSEYTSLITYLSQDVARNELIANELLTKYKNDYVCLLCLRISQVEDLKNRLGDDAVILTSTMKKKERAMVMNDLMQKNKKYIISTYGLFSQGINIPHLNVLFLCAPIKSEIKIKQSAGRLMRMAKDKTSATIVDFVDVEIEILQYQARKRQKILNRL